jgi:two-component system, NtrC family, response regulator AtoC
LVASGVRATVQNVMVGPRILIIEDEKLIRWSLAERLGREGYEVEGVETGEEGLKLLDEQHFDLLVLDYKLPGIDGLRVLECLRERLPDLHVILVTAHSSVDSVRRAWQLGASDYVFKPFDMSEMVLVVRKALEHRELRREVEARRPRSIERDFVRVVGESPAMIEVLGLVERVAATEATTILLLGESGTGKGLVAREIHERSNRQAKPFLTVTCTALQETLLEAELLGYEKGAFTDAKERKKGLFELADGGTIFLDEIGDISMAFQAKLLHFLEEKTFKRVGGTRDIIVDVRIVAATNRDLDQAVADGSFRRDLYYRLKIIPLVLPPLRDREGDVPLLIRHFIAHYNREFGKSIHDADADVIARLNDYDWPGNIRELRNLIERAILLGAEDVLKVTDLPQEIREAAGRSSGAAGFVLPTGGVRLEDLEREFVIQALERCSGNQTRAAGLLGLNRDQIRYRIEKFKLRGPKP